MRKILAGFPASNAADKPCGGAALMSSLGLPGACQVIRSPAAGWRGRSSCSSGIWQHVGMVQRPNGVAASGRDPERPLPVGKGHHHAVMVDPSVTPEHSITPEQISPTLAEAMRSIPAWWNWPRDLAAGSDILGPQQVRVG